MSVAQNPARPGTPLPQPGQRPDRSTPRAGPAVRRMRRAALAAAPAVAWALLSAWWTPRGPVTTAQALAAMAAGLAVGACAGLALRSRWAAVLAPGTFVAVFELARLGAEGPTVDAPHLSTYGVVAFLTGRGFHALVTLLPMVLAGCVAAGVVRRRAQRPDVAGGDNRPRGSRAALWARRGVAATTAAGLVVLALGLARPASTAPIAGPDGAPLAGSVAELTTVDVDGHELGLMVRGRSTSAPVLLFLAGGPGGTELGAMRHHLAALEDHFVVVTWDQRGTGRSYAALEPTGTLTLERAVQDTVAVTNHLRQRFGVERVYLLGQSWGSLLGVLTVQRHPELFHAYVGAGQMVSPVATDRAFYDDTLALARRTGDTALVETLTRNGPPPYTSGLAYEAALSRESELYPYDHSGNAEGAGQMSEGIGVREYALVDQVHALAGVVDTFALLYPRIQEVDLRTQAARLDVPVYLFQGRHEAPGRAGPALEWFEALDAPDKELVVAGTSGHRPLFEQPDAFVRFMTGTVLAGPAGTTR